MILKLIAFLIVIGGIGFVFLVTAGSGGPEAVEVVVVAMIVSVGALSIAVARRNRTRPAECSVCGGLNSPNAPSCKHCGAPL